jgi:hypothetical protein
VLLRVPLIEPGQTPHQWTANEGNNNRNPPIHGLHPAVPDGLGINASGLCFCDLLVLALLDSWAMKVLLAVSEPQPDATQMALETQGTSTWKHVEGKKIVAFHTVN